MKLAVDTNVLARAVTGDDRKQSPTAAGVLREATLIAISISCLCELAWVLRSGYDFSNLQIWESIVRLISAQNVVVDGLATDAGLAMLKAGGDFADGVIAFEGARLGGEVFASFDRKAVTQLKRSGKSALLIF